MLGNKIGSKNLLTGFCFYSYSIDFILPFITIVFFDSTGSQDVNIKLDNIRDPLVLPDRLFGHQVKNITLIDVKLMEFSSQSFLNLNQTASVTIKNSEIATTK
jgi:hypothetical protein